MTYDIDIGDVGRCLAGGTFICGMGGDGAPLITMNRFDGDYNDQKVFGCGGAFQLASAGIDVSAESSGEGNSGGETVGSGFEQMDSYLLLFRRFGMRTDKKDRRELRVSPRRVSSIHTPGGKLMRLKKNGAGREIPRQHKGS